MRHTRAAVPACRHKYTPKASHAITESIHAAIPRDKAESKGFGSGEVNSSQQI